MKKTALTIGLSFLTLFAVNTSQNSVHASEVEAKEFIQVNDLVQVDDLVQIQNDSIYVAFFRDYTSIPPFQIYYNDGKYQGYVTRNFYDPNGIGGYTAFYTGDVYRNAPIPHVVTPIQE